MKIAALVLFAGSTLSQPIMSQEAVNPFSTLMERAAAHAREHGATRPPVLSPNDSTVLDTNPAKRVPLTVLHRMRVRVIPWTTNDPERMRTIIRLGVDGLISDRPDLLQHVLAEERATSLPEVREQLAHFDVAGHRGARGLRPENTLPAFEAGLDSGIDTIETDTGVTTDHISLIWHDQFLNPQSCRRADGSPYTMANRVYIRDLSLQEAQRTFVCDKLRSGFPDQRNDLKLSPVAVAFALQEHLPNPYVPTCAEQLFRFTTFYAQYYRVGPGRSHPEAVQRAHTAEKVHFNLETKILPEHVPPAPSLPAEMLVNHTVSPQVFVDTLCGAILRGGVTARADVQSFDFRTLQLVEDQHPEIPTYYLTENAESLETEFVPAILRTAPTATLK